MKTSHSDQVDEYIAELEAALFWLLRRADILSKAVDYERAKIEAALAIGSVLPAHVHDYQHGWDACRAAFRKALTGGREK